MRTRRRFSAEFKARVALEAIKGDETVARAGEKKKAGTNCIQRRSRLGSARRSRISPRCSPRKGYRARQEPGWRDHQASRQDRSAGCGAGFFVESLRSLSLDRRKTMIDPGHPRLSIVRQCELASISRSSFYRGPTADNEETLRLMCLIDEQFLDMLYGSRQMARHLHPHRSRGRQRQRHHPRLQQADRRRLYLSLQPELHPRRARRLYLDSGRQVTVACRG